MFLYRWSTWSTVGFTLGSEFFVCENIYQPILFYIFYSEIYPLPLPCLGKPNVNMDFRIYLFTNHQFFLYHSNWYENPLGKIGQLFLIGSIRFDLDQLLMQICSWFSAQHHCRRQNFARYECSNRWPNLIFNLSRSFSSIFFYNELVTMLNVRLYVHVEDEFLHYLIIRMKY